METRPTRTRIAVVQFRAGTDWDNNVDRAAALLHKARQNDAKLAVFPELSFSPFFPQYPRTPGTRVHAEPIPGPTTDLFCRLAGEIGIVTVINLYEMNGQQRFDSSPVIDADGRLLGVTRMVHIMEGRCFHERDYYEPGDRGAPVFPTQAGKLGVAICYDRHFPEYMRALGVKEAEIVVVPQAGAVDEWPPGLFEAELQVAAMQNGYFTALANRVGEEDCLTFAGESFVTDPRGQVIARAPRGEEHLLFADLDLAELVDCPARRHFLGDRRQEIYPL